MSKCLCIPKWFCTHEVTDHGRVRRGPLRWYQNRVHLGETRANLRETYGNDAEDRCVSMYDWLCNLSAAQTAERRGWLCDQLGNPLTLEEIAFKRKRQVPDVTAVIEMLVNVGWLEWRHMKRRLSGAYSARELRAACAQPARRVRAECAKSARSKQTDKTDRLQIEIKKKRQTDRDAAGRGERPSVSCAPASCSPSVSSVSDSAGDITGCVNRLRLVGIEGEQAHELANEIGGDLAFVAEALEAVEILAKHRRPPRRGNAAYVVAYLKSQTGFNLPDGLDKHRTVPTRLSRMTR